ncbi:MAG: sigma 54-interacting transcriptional regulator, partial [Magnetococcales bacterium]|nr:sigma 54-interacting transcriptional regulator [Magnetococcales bacterium]
DRMVTLVSNSLERAAPTASFPGTSPPPHEEGGFDGFIGSSRSMQELFRTIGRLSNSEMTVLIHGESGSGKELVARSIHRHSPRRKGPFTAINMAAIPRNLIESELFGHEKGAFTGAVSQRLGHFAQAKGGTLFLDEIGDMPMEAQTRLLRVLQEGTYTRVGGSEPLRTNVRIIAATHQDLPASIGDGRFREDLYYRLNVIPILAPSLRTRKEDIPLLAEHFLTRSANKLGVPRKQISPAGVERLMAHDWPGNVRELENLIDRLMVLTPDDIIGPDALELPGRRTQQPTPQTGQQSPPSPGREMSLRETILRDLDRYFASLNGMEVTGLYGIFLRQLEEGLLTRVLQETNGNQVKAAQMLGINRNTLRKKIQDLDIKKRK